MRGRSLSIVHTESSRGWGGQEIRILTEARGFLDRGHRVTILAPAAAPIVRAAQRMGVPIDEVPIGEKRLSSLFALRRWLHAHRNAVDVLNTHSSTDSWLGALYAALSSNAPAVVRTRHLSTHVRDNLANRWLYRRGAAHIVTTGEAIRRQLARENGVALERVTSIPTGIDLMRFVPGDPRRARAALGLPERPTLGIVATLRAWKGHRDLFAALALDRAAWSAWQVLVIGGGPDREVLETASREAGLSDLVRFTGHQEEMPPWFQALDLLVLPSYGEEGVPQAILQAMACALAVVSTPIGAIAEAVEHGKTGVLVEPRNPPALAKALAQLRNDAGLRATYGAMGRARAQRDFGIDRMLDGMENVFRSVLS